ncbi:MAG: YdcF family protein [Fibrobacter sp.]|nr:YdcF family protein [Fibrobacter sp.]
MSRNTKSHDKKIFKRITAIAAGVLILLVAAFYLVMTKSGHWLVDDDEFDHVKWVVVLDGQSADMERSDFAANLLNQGRADSILILGRRNFRNRSNAEFYVDDFMQLGSFDSNAVFMAVHDDASTIGEAYTVIPWLKARKADTVLLLTSAPATHRVKRIFSALSGERPVYYTADIHHYMYDADSWYTNRESRKNWIREWAALAVSYIDLWPSGILTPADSTFYRPIVTVAEFERQKDPIVNLQDLLPKVQEKIKEVAATEPDEKTAADSVKTDTTAVKDSTKKN